MLIFSISVYYVMIFCGNQVSNSDKSENEWRWAYEMYLMNDQVAQLHDLASKFWYYADLLISDSAL